MNIDFNALWITETIRLLEAEKGRFSDSNINLKARIAEKTIENQIVFRAQEIAKQENLISAKSLFFQAAKLSLLILIIFSVLTGVGLTFSVLKNNPINIFWALISLLGLHFFTLIFWLFSAIFLKNQVNDSPSLIFRFWFWLTSRFSEKNKTVFLFPALFSLLSKVKANRWIAGMLTHFCWIIIFIAMSILLTLCFSFRSYFFVWETTLLHEQSFIHLVDFLSYLPKLLHFPVPSAKLIIETEKNLNHIPLKEQHLWASWLIGVIIVFGLFLRIFFFIYCFFRFKFAISYLKLDKNEPEFHHLAQRLSPESESIGIVDPENLSENAPIIFPKTKGKGKFLLAIEVENLPKLQFSDSIHFFGKIDDRISRNQVLAFLIKNPANAILIICDSNRSPDRGIFRFINELQNQAVETRIYFLQSGKMQTQWNDLLQKNQLQTADLTWLENK